MKDLTKTMHPRQPVENYSRHCSFPKLSRALKQKKLQKSCNLFSPVSRRSGPGSRKCPSTDSSAAAQIWNWKMIICTFCKPSQIKTASWSSQLLRKERVGSSKATLVEIPWTHLSHPKTQFQMLQTSGWSFHFLSSNPPYHISHWITNPITILQETWSTGTQPVSRS